MPKAFDLVGVEIGKGDTVAYAVRESDHAALRMGIVEDIVEVKDHTKLKVRVKSGSGFTKSMLDKVVTVEKLNRVLVVE